MALQKTSTPSHTSPSSPPLLSHLPQLQQWNKVIKPTANLRLLSADFCFVLLQYCQTGEKVNMYVCRGVT